MSYKAEIEIIIHLHEFRNIQIDRKGFAAIRFEIYDDSVSQNNQVIAYNIVGYHKNVSNAVREPTISENAAQSSTFRLQYPNERHYLNDIIQFKLLAESLPKLDLSKIFIKCTLLYANLYSFEAELNPAYHGMEEITLKLEDIEDGVFHYCQATFKNNYPCSFNMTFFAMITDFKLFPYSMRQQVIGEDQKIDKREKQRQSICELEDMLVWISKYIKNANSPLKYLYEIYAKPLRYSSYQLRTRVNSFHRHKKQAIEYRLPQFGEQVPEPVSYKEFMEFFSEFDANQVSIKQFRQEIYNMHEANFFFVQEVAQNMGKGLYDFRKLAEDYEVAGSIAANGRISREIKFGHQPTNNSHAKEVLEAADKMRRKQKLLKPYPISQYETAKVEEYIFHEICYSTSLKGQDIGNIKNQLPYAYDERNMLIICCHGFQASSLDMRVIHRSIYEVLPLASFLVSTANQMDTEKDINEMGERLAQEIKRHIKKQDIAQKQVILNFIGHSMGGVIARACLPYLPEFHKQLGFFCSLSSPHLGYSSGTNFMISTGLFFMRKMKQTKSLNQLSLADAQKPENTFLHTLSCVGDLRCFAKIILISSAEDSYVPWHSARICGYKTSKPSARIEAQMAENILGDSTVHRIDINFKAKMNDFDGFIGRKAHINMITNESIFEHINKVIPQLFDLRHI